MLFDFIHPLCVLTFAFDRLVTVCTNEEQRAEHKKRKRRESGRQDCKKKAESALVMNAMIDIKREKENGVWHEWQPGTSEIYCRSPGLRLLISSLH